MKIYEEIGINGVKHVVTKILIKKRNFQESALKFINFITQKCYIPAQICVT